jgi:catechol 2,3-dioxygenase-like lactoylglutathione lyase family enzyme
VFVNRLALEGQADFWLTAGGRFPTLVQISATTMAEAALHPKERFKSVSPCFLVDDVVKSAESYRDVLGFHFDRYWGKTACFVMLLRDSIEISLSKPGGSRIVRPNRKMHAEAPWDAYIRVNDLFALHKELQSKGAKVIRGPEETFYHTRELELEDCNGYVLCFGQNIED